MADIEWPSTVLPNPQLKTNEMSRQLPFDETNMQSGYIRRRRIGNGQPPTGVPSTFMMTASQLDFFYGWIAETLNWGTLPFLFPVYAFGRTHNVKCLIGKDIKNVPLSHTRYKVTVTIYVIELPWPESTALNSVIATGITLEQLNELIPATESTLNE